MRRPAPLIRLTEEERKGGLHTKCCMVTTREVVNGKSVVENIELA